MCSHCYMLGYWCFASYNALLSRRSRHVKWVWFKCILLALQCTDTVIRYCGWQKWRSASNRSFFNSVIPETDLACNSAGTQSSRNGWKLVERWCVLLCVIGTIFKWAFYPDDWSSQRASCKYAVQCSNVHKQQMHTVYQYACLIGWWFPELYIIAKHGMCYRGFACLFMRDTYAWHFAETRGCITVVVSSV